jgi:hypothetical protein
MPGTGLELQMHLFTTLHLGLTHLQFQNPRSQIRQSVVENPVNLLPNLWRFCVLYSLSTTRIQNWERGSYAQEDNVLVTGFCNPKLNRHRLWATAGTPDPNLNQPSPDRCLTETSAPTATSAPTETPAPTATPLPTAMTAPIIPTFTPLPKPAGYSYSDDFSTKSGDWNVFSDSDSGAAYDNGTYKISVKTAMYAQWNLPGAFDGIGDAVIEVDAGLVSGPNMGDFGIVCGYKDNDNFHVLAVANDGYAEILRWVNGDDDIFASKENAFTITDTYHLGASCV